MYGELFAETNVILDLLIKREPFHQDALQVFSMAEKGQISLSVSSLSFTTLDYFLKKEMGKTESRNVLIRLKSITRTLSVDEKIIERALASQFDDFEDGVQYYCALQHRAEIILTRNLKDFKTSDLPVLTPQQFIAMMK